ncbi:MAG TPA: hypothetical protein VLE43_03405 [Candidatus Saccharimonadia bacterium]|nr:hypothetical protein [Candidatus Saccharimonadia bacterium]
MSQQANSSLRVKRFWRYYAWVLVCRALPAVILVGFVTSHELDWSRDLVILWCLAFIIFSHTFWTVQPLPVSYRFRDGVLVATRASGAVEYYERWVMTWENGLRVIHAQNSAKTLRLPVAAYTPAQPHEVEPVKSASASMER